MKLPNLPVSSAFPDIRRALKDHVAAVLTAPPGSGKTTLVPLALLDEPWLAGKKILLLEPRRMAARAAAWRMADLSGSPLGGLVGYHIRLEKKTSRETRIEVLTEGLLSRRILSDPELADVGLVIFDEFHERSLHADFGLALSLDVQRGLRPDLRLLVMSATLDATAVARSLRGPDSSEEVPVVSAEGRMFPVETTFLDLRQEPSIARRTAAGIRRALSEHEGSVLAFLPGEGEIRTCAEILSAPHMLSSDTELRPLFAALTRAEQDAALRPCAPGRRKVVLATSIAESSLTIDGISCVVDSGMARISRFSPDTGMSHLETIRISRDRADQRTGRAGRLGPGYCYRLWGEDEDRRLAPTALPEILVADLASVALACADWGASAVPWPTPPPPTTWRRAREMLQSLGAVDASGSITEHGRELSRLGTHPRLSHMVLSSRRGPAESVHEACLLAAALSEGLPANACPTSNAEHLVRDLEEGGGALSSALRSRIRELARSWERGLDATGRTPLSTGLLLSFAYPDRIARRRPLAKDAGRYLTREGRGVRLRDGESLARSEWIVVADIDDADSDGTIRLGAPIDAADVETNFRPVFETHEVLAWNERLLRVEAVERECLGAIVVRERPRKDADPEAVLSCLLKGIQSAGIERLGWSDGARALQARIEFLRKRLPEESIPDCSDEALSRDLDVWLGDRLYGLSSLAQAAEVDLVPALESRLGPLLGRLSEWAPTHLTVASGSHIRIDYAGDEPSASVRIQETFGMAATPRVAKGRVPVRLQLLSPAMRPVQITSDLSSFWREGYPEVRKELRGRYPRHEWPEDPAHAAATRRAKPRKP